MQRLSTNPLIVRALEVAIGKIGVVQVAARLSATVGSVEAWRDGFATMPERKFLKLVDVLTSLEPSWEDWDGKS